MATEAKMAMEKHQLAPLESYDYKLLCFKLHQAAIKAQEVVLKHWQPEGVYDQGADIEQALSELGIRKPADSSPIAPNSALESLQEEVKGFHWGNHRNRSL